MSEARVEQLGSGHVRVSGDLTFQTVSAALRQSRGIFGAEAGSVQFDLSRVGRADSAGLALLIHWLRDARASGREVLFLDIPEQMLAIARVSDLQDILPRSAA